MTTTETIPANSTTVNTNIGDVPDLTAYYQIHQAMRVANEQIIAGLTNPTLADDDRRRAAAMGKWFAGYCGELRAHHSAEDDLIFPALAARVPAYASYAEMLAADHDRLDEIIDGLATALAQMATHGSSWSTAKDGATAYAVELRDLLIDHLAVEDSDVIPMIERHFGKEEYAVIEKQIIKAISPRQALWTVPWWMATAEPSAAAKTLSQAPLPLKVIYYTTRRRYARLVQRAFG
jgi:iron-sulfur cluster repair protein YtfE (RIC family)